MEFQVKSLRKSGPRVIRLESVNSLYDKNTAGRRSHGKMSLNHP